MMMKKKIEKEEDEEEKVKDKHGKERWKRL